MSSRRKFAPLKKSTSVRRELHESCAHLSPVVEVPVTMHWLWAPFGLLFVLPLPALVMSFAIPDDQYQSLFGQPSFLTFELRGAAAAYFLLLVSVFLLGVVMRPKSLGSIRLGHAQLEWLHRSVRGLAWLTFGAYAIWFIAALARGFNLSTVAALLRGDPGTMYVLRYDYFETLGGVTTWMQAGALLVPLAILRSKSGGRSAKPIVASVIAAALLRAFLNSERLALIEILLSLVISLLLFRSEAPKLFRSVPGTLACVVLSWAGLFLAFVLFEYFRSWASVQDSYSGGLWSYAGGLFIGYFATALNLAAFDISMLQGSLSLPSLFDGGFYSAIFGPSALDGVQKAFGLETFTNRSGLLLPFAAFGWVGALLFFIAFSFCIAFVARRASQGSAVAAVLYAASAVGLLEIVRIFYFGSSRFLPVIVIGLVLAFTWAMSKRSNHRPRGRENT